MMDYIDAPMPYIMGIPRAVWKAYRADPTRSLPSDAAVLDLDKRRWRVLPQVPELPTDLQQGVLDAFQALVHAAPIVFVFVQR
jgi:hypothetical protein